MKDIPQASAGSSVRPIEIGAGNSRRARRHNHLPESGAHAPPDGDSPPLLLSTLPPESAEETARGGPGPDPYRSELNSFDEKRYQQYWRLAAAEELEEMSDTSLDGFYDAPEEVRGYDGTPDSGIHDFSTVDPEMRARYEEEWKSELTKIEDEIMTLRQVLSAKMKQSQDLKRKLGITAWKEFREDMEQGIKNIQESTAQTLPGLFTSPAYQKTSQTLRVAGEKTTSTIGSISATVTKKLGEYKNSNTFKSFEEKVGSAYSSVKTKVSNSRSNSVNSFDEALNNVEGRSSAAGTPLTSPTIPEGKPLL